MEIEIKVIKSWIQELTNVQNVIRNNQSKTILIEDNQVILEKVLKNTKTIKK